MREITQIIYEFEELRKEVQEKLIGQEEEYQKEVYCEDCLEEDMAEKARELLKKYFKDKATLNNILYDLGYCQGDGAMVEFTLDDGKHYIEVQHNSYCRYYHENSFSITYPSGDYLTDKQEEKLKEKIIKMNEELKKYGYELIEQEYNREEIIETLSKNEYYADGTIY